MLTDSSTFVRFGRVVDEANGMSLVVVTPPMNVATSDPSGVREPTYLRIERRKRVLTLKYSKDGQTWTAVFEPWMVVLPKKLQVGVFAESMAPGSFAPVFDQFEWTPLK